MICSTLATIPLEEVAQNAGQETTIWFQVNFQWKMEFIKHFAALYLQKSKNNRASYS